jgi:hypothetical protein
MGERDREVRRGWREGWRGGGVPYSSDDKEDMLKEDRERVGHAGGLLFNCAQHGTAQHQYQQSEWQRGRRRLTLAWRRFRFVERDNRDEGAMQ